MGPREPHREPLQIPGRLGGPSPSLLWKSPVKCPATCHTLSCPLLLSCKNSLIAASTPGFFNVKISEVYTSERRDKAAASHSHPSPNQSPSWFWSSEVFKIDTGKASPLSSHRQLAAPGGRRTFAAQIFRGGELAARRAFHFRASQVLSSGCGEAVTPSLPCPGSQGFQGGELLSGAPGQLKEDLNSKLPVCSDPILLKIFVAGERTDGPAGGQVLSVFNKQMEHGVPRGSPKVSGVTLVFQVHAGERAQ